VAGAKSAMRVNLRVHGWGGDQRVFRRRAADAIAPRMSSPAAYGSFIRDVIGYPLASRRAGAQAFVWLSWYSVACETGSFSGPRTFGGVGTGGGQAGVASMPSMAGACGSKSGWNRSMRRRRTGGAGQGVRDLRWTGPIAGLVGTDLRTAGLPICRGVNMSEV